MTTSIRKNSHRIDTRLKIMLRLYFLIAIILVGVLLFNIIRGAIVIELGLIGVLVGIGLGIISSRMYHISWNKDAKKVVSRLDIYGVAIIILYALFEIFRNQIVGYFTHGVQVGTVGFAILAGVMFGRVIGTRGKIQQVLRDQEVFG